MARIYMELTGKISAVDLVLFSQAMNIFGIEAEHIEFHSSGITVEIEGDK